MFVEKLFPVLKQIAFVFFSNFIDYFYAVAVGLCCMDATCIFVWKRKEIYTSSA
jgi:hypothetical protein